MIVQYCSHEEARKHGKDRYGNQRFRCKLCGKTFVEEATKPLGNMQIERKTAEIALQLIVEGSSIRTVERVTGLHRNTICRLVALVGNRCEYLMRRWIHNIPAKHVEMDETWGYVFCKQKTSNRLGHGEDTGDAYTFIAIDRDTKLVLAYHVGKRDGNSTAAMVWKLSRAVFGQFQLTTDGFGPYRRWVYRFLKDRTSFAQLTKIYGVDRRSGAVARSSESRYSPAEIIDVQRDSRWGTPDRNMVSTSFVERFNLTIRMTNRRMTRLTNGFSKTWQNHEAAMALCLAHYNFCKIHGTIGTTPATEAGLTDKPWKIPRLLDECATQL